MSRRDHNFEIEEYYHCFNRGTDKRITFADTQDYQYFITSLKSYNSVQSYGKLRLSHDDLDNQRLVEILAYCILPNHYHLLLQEKVENGISKFMKRVGVGYTMYFNEKYKRNGVLFQGTFKSRHIQTDQDLRQVFAYVVSNNVVHSIEDTTLYKSWYSQTHNLVRGLNSNFNDQKYLLEIVEIIKEQRLTFD